MAKMNASSKPEKWPELNSRPNSWRRKYAGGEGAGGDGLAWQKDEVKMRVVVNQIVAEHPATAYMSTTNTLDFSLQETALTC